MTFSSSSEDDMKIIRKNAENRKKNKMNIARKKVPDVVIDSDTESVVPSGK